MLYDGQKAPEMKYEKTNPKSDSMLGNHDLTLHIENALYSSNRINAIDGENYKLCLRLSSESWKTKLNGIDYFLIETI